MRLVFIGAVDGSHRALETLLEAGVEVARVVTLAEQYAHRHSDFCDLSPLANSYGVPVTAVNNANEADCVAAIAKEAPDYVLVVGWSQILKSPLLAVPKLGTLGFHPTLLPQYRGRAALPWLILNGVASSGVTLFHIDEGTDSGEIAYQSGFELDAAETATTLYAKVSEHIDRLMRALATDLVAGNAIPQIPQDDSLATYTARRTPVDGYIDWTRNADDIWTLIRASTRPYPGAFTYHNGVRMVIWAAEYVAISNQVAMPGQVALLGPDGVLVKCGVGYVRLIEVQVGNDEPVAASAHFDKPHEKLGIPWPDAYDSWLVAVKESL